jgi:4-hydroxy-3-methylbut-2-enyl diphosphate reductase IspH
LEERGFTVIDATCPRVKRNQEMAAAFAREGRRVIIAGDKDHGEVAGLRGYVRAGEGELLEREKRLKAIKAIIPKSFCQSKGLSIEQVKDRVNNFNADCIKNSLGETTKFSYSAASKILNHKGFDTASIFLHIAELFETAVFAYEEGQRKNYFRPDGTKHKEHPNFIGYKNFVNKFEVKETKKQYYIRFTVQEEVPSKKHPGLPHNVLHSSFVSDVEKYDMDSPPISVIIKAAVEPPTPYDERLAQFFKSVKPAGLALVGQSTMSGAEYRAAAEKLRSELGADCELVVADTVCPEAEKRQDAVRALCGAAGEARVSGVLVVGGKSSANTKRLFELAKESGVDAELIQGPQGIPERFYRMARVGLCAGASTPDEVVDAVEKALVRRRP